MPKHPKALPPRFYGLTIANAKEIIQTIASAGSRVGIHSADLLTDLKSGYLLKADPRQQFWAQFLGVLAGSLFVVPAYRLLIPTADLLGTDKWPVPGAQTWKSVAELLAKGVDSLHPTAQAALVIGGLLGIDVIRFSFAFETSSIE